MTLPERILKLHAALENAGLPHAFGGAIALAFWTEQPRGTRDLDVNVFVPQAEARRVLAGLADGIATPPEAEQALLESGQVRLWWDDTPVDLFLDYAPVHEAAARHVALVPFEGQQIPVLGPVELAIFKLMFDRTKDWADVEAIHEAGHLDVRAVRRGLLEMVDADDVRIARLDLIAQVR